MGGYKRFFATVLTIFIFFVLTACGDTPEETVKKPTNTQKSETEIVTEEPVELIYAKTPDEAAEKCLEAIYSGNLDDAKHYIEYNGNAFKELSELKNGIMQSYKAESNAERKAKVEKYILNVFSKFSYSKKSLKESGDSATVVYSVSMPDISQINYSAYSDSYMTAKGISPESLMTELEGMNSTESAEWSLGFDLDVRNYIFESGADIPMTNAETTVQVKKGKEGWIVTEVKNLAG